MYNGAGKRREEFRARTDFQLIMSLIRTLWFNTKRDDLTGEAAKMAYYFFLSLFPVVLCVFAVTGIVGGQAAFSTIAATAERVVPDYAWQFVQKLIREITDSKRPGILSVGILLTIWASSNGIAALTGGLNAIYNVEESRAWWKRRALALIVMLVAITVIVLFTTIIANAMDLPPDSFLGTIWRWMQWPFALIVLTGTAWLAYAFLPARNELAGWKPTLIGAGTASISWIGVTLLFRVYLSNFGRYSSTYGAVGAVIVLLIWFYLAALVMLFGAEVAATIELGRQKRT